MMYEYEVQGKYGDFYGWETVDSGHPSMSAALGAKKVYDENEPEYPHRVRKVIAK